LDFGNFGGVFEAAAKVTHTNGVGWVPRRASLTVVPLVLLESLVVTPDTQLPLAHDLMKNSVS
jgi:hypothetical protein